MSIILTRPLIDAEKSQLRDLITKFKANLKQPNQVANRFLQLFEGHGVERSQIPRLFPKVSYQDISTPLALTKLLTPEILDEVSEIFNVRVEWLESVEDVIYQRNACYKRPHLFFKSLEQIKIGDDDYLLRVITPCERLNHKDTNSQPFILAVLERVGELNDEFIYRYHLWDYFDWSDAECRIQVKAMALAFFELHQFPIPIYTINHKDFQQIAEGKKIPFEAMNRSVITDPSLEDYFLDQSQSGKSKESDELNQVMAYRHEYKLDNLAANVFQQPISSSVEKANNSKDVLIQQKGGIEKNRKGNELKRQCVLYWLDNQQLSNDEAARRFYSRLEGDDHKVFTPTNAERTFSRAISEYKRRDELKANEKLPKWLTGFDTEM